jgi:hypothetical protein
MRRALLLVPIVTLLAAGLGSCGGGSGGVGDIAIAQITLNISSVTQPPLPSNSFTFSVLRDNTPSTIVGDGTSVTPADQGSTLTFGPGDDPEFAALALILMNGVDDPIRVRGEHANGSNSGSGNESSLLVGLVPGFTGPDLSGYVLTRIQIVIDQLSAAPDGMNGTVFSWSVRYVFRGVD